MLNLKLSKAIYKEDAIHKAITAFSNISSISCFDVGNSYICSFSGCVEDEVLTSKEFENYLIDLLNSKNDYT